MSQPRFVFRFNLATETCFQRQFAPLNSSLPKRAKRHSQFRLTLLG